MPFDHHQVTQVTPTCASDDNQTLRLVSGPTAVSGTAAGIPLGVLAPGTAVRYSCEFEALKDGAVQITASGTGNGLDPITQFARTVAPPRTITKVIACAACEMDPPAIAATVLDPVSGNAASLVNGWYNEDVVVRLTAVDSGVGVTRVFYRIIRGVQSGPLVTVSAPANANTFSVDIPVMANGPTSLLFWAEDENGTTSPINTQCQPVELPGCTADLDLFLDSEDPAVIFDFSGQGPNPAGWFKQPISVPYRVFDTFSGVDTQSGSPSPIQFTTEGTGQFAEVHAQDIAGNVTNATTMSGAYGGPGPINIDFTAPTVTVDTPGGLYQGSVAVNLMARDNLSGVQIVRYGLSGAVLQGHQTYTGMPITIATPGITRIEIFAMDAAGNATDADPTMPGSQLMTVTYDINGAPKAFPDTAVVDEDSFVDIDVLANDIDANYDTLTAHAPPGRRGAADHGQRTDTAPLHATGELLRAGLVHLHGRRRPRRDGGRRGNDYRAARERSARRHALQRLDQRRRDLQRHGDGSRRGWADGLHLRARRRSGGRSADAQSERHLQL